MRFYVSDDVGHVNKGGWIQGAQTHTPFFGGRMREPCANRAACFMSDNRRKRS